MVLVLTGFVGGMFTAVAGSGVDICSFSVLSLLFRVNEKVSTPTSVILMAVTSCAGNGHPVGPLLLPFPLTNQTVFFFPQASFGDNA